jgi:hypothetical protein
MTVFASGGFHGLSYQAESTFGSATHATMISLRHTSCGLQLSKDTFQSAELRSDRQISDFRHGNQKPAGNIGFEFSYEEFDTFLEATLGGTWQAAYSVVSSAIGVKSTGNLFYSATATFTTLATYDLISVSGFTGSRVGNNVVHRITGALPHTLSITGTTLVTSAIGATITIARCPSVTAGTTQRSFAIERTFSDISKYQQFTGCVINTLSLSVKPNAIVTGEFAMVAKGAASTSTAWDSSPTASKTNSPYDAFTGVIKEGGYEVGYVTALDFKLDNAADPVYVVGSDTTPAIPLGRSNVSGSMDVMFQDLTMLRKFEDETASSVEFYLGSGDPGGHSYRFYLPNVKYGSADNPANDEKPITLKMSYQALYSATEGTNIKVTKIA